MHTLKLSGLAALTVAFGLGACSKTTYETPAPAASTGATVTTTTTAGVDTTGVKKDSTVGYSASGTTSTTSTTVVTTPSTTVTATTPTTSTTMTPGMSMNGAQSLQLTALNNSAFTGMVTLTDLGNKTRVAVTLNAPANSNATSDHNTSIRTGTCAAPGAKVVGLNDVEGNGKASNTEIEYRVSQLTDGRQVVVVNENPGDRAVACVAIPRR